MKKIILITIGIVGLVALLVWAYIASSQPLPGAAELQEGREHHPEETALKYNFNPPTSGDHYPSWIKKGVYDTPRPDGNLVHSLEHGYVIIWYDCSVASARLINPFMRTAFAQTPMTEGSEASASATLQDLPEAFRSDQCGELRKQFTEAVSAIGSRKIIAVPRPQMGKRIVLTAWGRKMELDRFDFDQLKQFVDSYRDHGPEQTNEP